MMISYSSLACADVLVAHLLAQENLLNDLGEILERVGEYNYDDLNVIIDFSNIQAIDNNCAVLQLSFIARSIVGSGCYLILFGLSSLVKDQLESQDELNGLFEVGENLSASVEKIELMNGRWLE